MDVLVFGVLIGVVIVRRDRRREIRSHVELIEDFKKWDSEEARLPESRERYGALTGWDRRRLTS